MTRPPSGPASGQPGGSTPGGQMGMPATPSGFIGRYQTLERIAEGGMGALYLARDPAIDRLVAIKLLRRGFDTEAMRERFAREARAAGRLRHPNIVTIFDVGEHDGDPFIAMEFLAGETLGELIRQGARLSLSRRLRLLEELCDGLAYAHRAGLVHRDIKPANLMVDAGGVLKILDFGIVRVSDSGMTQAGVLVGTINYMSPEQVLGTGVDHRSDIFAVGLVAYELLSGRQAFPGTIKDGLLKRLPNAEIEPLSDIVPGLDAEVVAIVERALRKDPADRYQDLTRMRNDCARARQRIEGQEDRAAAEAVAGAGETALIARDATSPGVALEAPHGSSELLADAERAITDGHYRLALTFAGRAAAIDPRDRAPTVIAARAEAGLLDLARSSADSSGAGRAPSSGSGAGSATPPPSAAGTGQVSNRGTWLATGVAMLALVVAAIAVWPRLGPDSRDAAPLVQSPAAQGSDAAGVASEVSTDEVGSTVSAPEPEPPQTAAEPPPPTEPPPPPIVRPAAPRQERPSTPAPSSPPPATPSQTAKASEPAAAPPPAGPVRVGAGVQSPRRTHRVEPRYPTAALAAGTEGTVRVEITIDREGRVADARVVQSVPLLDDAALTAVRQWQFEPTLVAGERVVVIETVDVPFARPEAPKPPAALPGESASRSPAAKLPEPPAPGPPPRDLTAEAEAAVRDVLRRYEAAWEALDFDAVQRVHALSASEARAVRDTIRGASSYAMGIVVHGIDVDSGLQTASAECTITRTFEARIGSIPPQTTRNSLRFEKRGGAWVIVSIR